MDKNEFAERVTAAEDTLYHIAKSVLKRECDCEDAVSEAIVTAYGNLHSLKDERFFKTWLCRILINKCYQICRANRRVVPLEDYMEAAPSAEQRETLGVFEAVMQLKPELRLVLVLRYVEGFQTAEVAKMLQIPAGTVKSRLSRARTELKSLLGEKEVLLHEQ